MTRMDKNLIDYLIEHTDERFDKLEKKVERLWELKMMLIGGCIVISGVCSVLVNLLLVYLKVQ